MDDPDRKDVEGRRRQLPLLVKMTDEGNIPGRPSITALAVIVGVVVVGLAAIYALTQ